MTRTGQVGGTREAYGCLVAPAVFKTVVARDPGQAGSIPVRLRHRIMSRTSRGPFHGRRAHWTT
jgi:hypothetical protein